MSSIRVVALVATLVVASGCAHRTVVPLRPAYATELKAGEALAKVSPSVVFSRGDFVDKRPDKANLAVFKQGVNTYTLVEERPIADALYEGLKSELLASKQQWSESAPGDVKVNITFLSLNAVRNAGFVSVGATATVQIKVDLANGKTGDVFYSNVYSGTDKRDKALIGFMSLVTASIDAAIVRCVQSVGDDAELVKALGKRR